jgi:hypothetical protein
MIRSKGIILPQDYHTEGVSSPEKRFRHPRSNEEEHSHRSQSSKTSPWWREFQVCSCSRSERPFYANHRTRPSCHFWSATPGGLCSARDLFLLEFKPQRAERAEDQKRFLSLRPMNCPFTPGLSPSTKLIESSAAADPLRGAEMAVSCGSPVVIHIWIPDF